MCEQVILATNDLALFKPEFYTTAACWQVAGGSLSTLEVLQY